jgi:hypothetical protein
MGVALVAADPAPDVARPRHSEGVVVTSPPPFFDWLLRRSLPAGQEGDSIRGTRLKSCTGPLVVKVHDVDIAHMCCRS